MISPNAHFGRTLGATAQRHALLLLLLFCVVASACFLFAPLLGRRYSVHSQVAIKLHPLEGMPELRAVPDSVVKELAPHAAAQGVDLALVPGDADGSTITMAATGPTRDGPLGQMQFFADQARLALGHHADELASAHRAELVKLGDRLSAQEDTLGKQIEQFRTAHRGVLPDDPSSVTAQFEKLSNRLDESQQRQQELVEMIKRLKNNKATHGSAAAPTPLPPRTEDPAANGPAPTKPENDPEVLALTAQLGIINEMIDDNLNKKHRTEQHPDVIDLRSRQEALQKQVDAAKDRAAAGKPPPANIHQAGGTSAGTDPTLLAAQAIDLRIEELQGEIDTRDVEVRTLTAQRDALQKKVDDVMPVRRQYETFTTQLAAAQKEHQSVNASLAQYDRSFPAGQSPAGALMDIGALQLASDSNLPSFPQVPLVYGFSILLAGAIATAAAWLLYRTDHTLHTQQQAAAVLEIPILGSVVELRPPASAMRVRLWRTLLRPVFALLLLLITVGSAVLCYRHLADSTFSHSLHDRGLSSILSSTLPPEGRP